MVQIQEIQDKHTRNDNQQNNNDKIKINANTVVINPFPNNNNNDNNTMITNNNNNQKDSINQNEDRINMLKHNQRINYKHLIHPNIDFDRINIRKLILFDKYESLIQLNKDNNDNNIFYSIKTNLEFNDPKPIVSPIIEKGKVKHYKLTCQSIDIAKHFIAWFFHMKDYESGLQGAFIKPWNQINKQKQQQHNKDMIERRNNLTYGRPVRVHNDRQTNVPGIYKCILSPV